MDQYQPIPILCVAIAAVAAMIVNRKGHRRRLSHWRSGDRQPELYRFLDAGDTETFRMRSRPASKKRRGTKSREVGRRRSSECYEVLDLGRSDLGRSKSGGVETRGPVKRCGAIFAI